MLHIAYIVLAISGGRGDLASYWSFDAIEDDKIVETASGLHATVHGATLKAGALHGGLYFDGADDFLAVDAMPAVQKTIGSLDEGTISAWFRFDHNPGVMDIEPIFYLGAANQYSSFGTTANGYELEIGHFSAQRRLYWTLISTEGENTDIPLCWSTTDHINTSRWYHVVSTVSESEGTHVYLDNVEIFNPSELTWNFGDENMCRFLNDVTVQEVLWFGKGLWDNEEKFYKGVIDEVKIWNRAITSSEVNDEYERVASVGAIQIDEDVADEIIVSQGIELAGTYDNIVELSWRIDDGNVTASDVESLEPTWLLSLSGSEMLPGRHVLNIRGRNAALRSFTDSRVVIQPDLNADGAVNIHDLLMLIGVWGDCSCPEDFSGNGRVDVADVLLLIGAWG